MSLRLLWFLLLLFVGCVPVLVVNRIVLAAASANEIQSIATASEEQSATSDEINNSINNVNELTSRSSAAMSECAQAVSELARQSQELNTLVENMKAG